MHATRPEDVDYLLAHAFNANDLDTATNLYEPGASVRRLPEAGGTIATGSVAVREVMASYVGLNPRMELVVHHVTQAGDIALLRSQWRITGTGPDGETVELKHHGCEVVRRQADGTWRFVIDHPFGADSELAVDFDAIPELPPAKP